MSAQLPRGTRIAFEREGNIFVAPYPDLHAAVKVGQGQDPDISADGKRVAFEERTVGSERMFCIRDAATGRLIKRHAGTMPHFSPDGRRIAFSRFAQSRWTLWLSDVALTAPRKLTGSGKDDPAFPSHWTSKGLLIAYSEQLGGSLYALRPDGSVARKSTIDEIAGKQDTSIPFGCAWSDDLSQIAFEAGTGEELVESGQPLVGLYLYDFTTKKRRLLTPRGMSGGGPVWYSRDLLVFVSGRNTKRYTPSQIQVLEVSTGSMHSLIPNAGSAAPARRGD
jgi:Tol biopolymer transport system component